MNLEEKTISSDIIYESSFISLKVDQVLLPDGNTSKRAIVIHPGASVIVPIDDDNNVILIQQFRKPIEKVIIELPAGKLDENEEPVSCAKRELTEETGYIANKIIKLTQIYTTPGFSNEILHIFLAMDLIKGNNNTDKDEFLEVFKVKLDEAVNWVYNGKILDSKTIIGLLFAKNYFERVKK